MKTCRKCGHLFETANCQKCSNARVARWRLKNAAKVKADEAKRYAGNAEKIKARSAVWRLTNPEKVKAFRVDWYAKNSEVAKAAATKWYAENSERARANATRWRIANPSARRVHHQNRRANKLRNGGVLSKGLVRKLFILQKGRCACCRKPLGNGFHLDHRTPLALGGANEDWNMQLLRSRCNSQKRSKDPIEFMQSRGFLL